jgi:hypothetical protein
VMSLVCACAVTRTRRTRTTAASHPDRVI